MNATIAKEAESMRTNARPRFLATCRGRGIHDGITQHLAGCPTDEARILIGMFSGDKAHKEAVLEAYELYLAESGRVTYVPGPKMLMK